MTDNIIIILESRIEQLETELAALRERTRWISAAHKLSYKMDDGKQEKSMSSIKHKSMPITGDYFEGYIESQNVNPKNNLTWYETYVKEFNKWKKENFVKRKKNYPRKLQDFVSIVFLITVG